MKPLVYLAGPYSSSPVENTSRIIDKAEELTKLGFVVLIPHLSLLWDFKYPKSADFWYDLTLEYLRRCDLMYRMKGVSKGSDLEEKFAKENNIPIIYEGEEYKWIPQQDIS